eukprot:Nitzschia sp. Nitz4//scaffold94_size78252//74771//76641//NITZ4_005478-RA/size78252-augustus-gene-0.68-mRNA-1//1//CDS//3329560410//6273//frame0
MPLFKFLWKKQDDDESSGDEVEDASADSLSHIGMAAYEELRKHHNHHHHELWNVTKGKMVGDLFFTPRDAFVRTETVDPPTNHSDWFPEAIGEILARTEDWCDVMSLAPPDGLFLKAFQQALAKICARPSGLGGRIVIRMMFGNIVGAPVNCTTVIRALTKDLPPDAASKIKLWVGSWRKGVSWNHAKIIAVDGRYLWTGGHNFWDKHYLQVCPVNDLSLELEGGPAKDAHRYANAQWGYIVKKQSTAWGRFVDKNIPDALDVPRRARVTVSEFPETDAAEFPPYWKEPKLMMRRGPAAALDPDYVSIITLGRYGAILKKSRPSDDAFVAMIDAARTIIRMTLQDLGPMCLPGTKMALPGTTWPTAYLDAMARVIWLYGVDIEIILSNPGSVPGGCNPAEANYGYGWSCADVASEIIKRIQEQFPDAPDGELRQKVVDNLRICFIKSPRGGSSYKSGETIGLHSKHFIVDDVCCYIGSQNLYICDLAEWGIVIDNAEQTERVKAQYWDPMWKVSYTADDCEVDAVMDGLKIDRTAVSASTLTHQQAKEAKQCVKANQNLPSESDFYPKKTTSIEDASSEEDEEEASDGED